MMRDFFCSILNHPRIQAKKSSFYPPSKTFSPYFPSLKTQGWRQKISPVEIFSTTGDSLLAHKLAIATRNERYKPSDRSDLANVVSLGARRSGRVSHSNKNCHPSFSASLNVKGSSSLPSPLSKGEPEGSNISLILYPPP